MGHVGDQIVAVMTAIVGVAILAVLVSRNSNTAGVIQSAGGAFAQMLSTAVSPVTGNTVMGPTTGFSGSGLNLNTFQF